MSTNGGTSWGATTTGSSVRPTAAGSYVVQFRAVDGASSIGGLGVGLYVVKEIVDRHGGEVWVQSEEGAGSTFFVALPLAAALE